MTPGHPGVGSLAGEGGLNVEISDSSDVQSYNGVVEARTLDIGRGQRRVARPSRGCISMFIRSKARTVASSAVSISRGYGRCASWLSPPSRPLNAERTATDGPACSRPELLMYSGHVSPPPVVAFPRAGPVVSGHRFLSERDGGSIPQQSTPRIDPTLHSPARPAPVETP